jgi:hypothetical protein
MSNEKREINFGMALSFFGDSSAVKIEIIPLRNKNAVKHTAGNRCARAATPWRGVALAYPQYRKTVRKREAAPFCLETASIVSFSRSDQLLRVTAGWRRARRTA